MGKRYIFYFLLVPLLLLGSCSSNKVSCPGSSLADRQVLHFAQEVEKEKEFIPLCFGSCMIDSLSNFYFILGPPHSLRVTIPQARKLIVEFMERFKAEVNGNEEIKPYLREYPVDCINITIMLTFCDPSNKTIPQEFVATVWQREGFVHYAFIGCELGEFLEGDGVVA